MMRYKDSWDKMMAVERRVLINQFLRPVQNGSLSLVLPAGSAPRFFDDHVKEELVALGAPWGTTHAYEWAGPSYGRIYQSFASPDSARYEVWDEDPEPRAVQAGMPTPANESIEEQIERINNMLNEKESPIDLRIYRTQIGCALDTTIGGAEMEIETQIRGIEGITTVRLIADTKRRLTPTTQYVVYEIKFELLGAASRKEYREAILFPGLRRVPGLNIVDWTLIHRTNVRGTVRTVRENLLKEFGFTNTPYTSQHSNMNQMVTPRPALQTMIDDWSEGGVQLYDMPTRDFRARYHRFIKKGAQLPVHLSIGQNGRAVITGNEDLVWFAQKAGLEELPVFIRYQKQV
jgi:hypothetical protein